MMTKCPYCGDMGPPIEGHCPHWPDLTPENCCICKDARRIAELEDWIKAIKTRVEQGIRGEITYGTMANAVHGYCRNAGVG